MLKGFYFSLEASLSLIIFTCLIVLIPFFSAEKDLSEVYLSQKANDLVKVWALEGNNSVEEMSKDIAFVFPGRKTVIGFKGQKIILEGSGEKPHTTKGFIVCGKQIEEITLVVFY